MLTNYCYQTDIRFQSLNCPVPSPLLCGLDIGYSGIKIQSPRNASIIPSIVVKARNDSPLLINGEDIRYRDEKGQMWYVGSLAKKTLLYGSTAIKSTTLLGRQRVQSEEFLVQSRIGFFFAKLRGLPEGGYDMDERPLKVQTGLPPEFIVQDTETLLQRLTGEHSFYVRIGKRPWLNVKVILERRDIHVCKQPFGTLMSSVISEAGVMTNPALLKKNVLILDAGFHTTDTYHFIQGAKEGASLTWENYSMQEVYQRTCSDILRESGNKADVSVYNLEKAFDSGVIHYGPKKEPYDFKKNFYGNLRSVCNELLQELNAAYDNMINVDVILLTGGTGVAWERYIRDFYKDTKALEIILSGEGREAARANVRGYYNLLVSRFR